MSGSQLDLVLVGVYTLLCWVLVLLLVKPLRELWSRREEYWFVNRHPSATWIIITCLFLYVAITRPLKLYCEYLCLGNDSEGAFWISSFVFEALNSPILHGMLIVYCTRYWLMYFDIQMAVKCNELRWKELLLTAPETDDRQSFDWFTAHKLTLGSWNYLKKVDAALISLVFCLVLTVNWFSTEKVGTLHIVGVFVVLAFITSVSMKMPRYRDTINAHDEHVFFLKVGCPFFLAFLVFVAVGYFKRSFAITLAKQTVSTLCFYSLLCGILMWAPLKFDYSSLRLRAAASLSLSSQKQTGVKASASGSVLLSHILSQTDGFNAFMEHLFSEFSYENLLCCVELLQFRKLRKAAVADEDIDEELQQAADGTAIDKTKGVAISLVNIAAVSLRRDSHKINTRVYRFQFPEEIMDLSPTIATNESESFQRRFLQLYDKYVSPSASMPVNVSFGTRQRLTKLAEELREPGGMFTSRRSVLVLPKKGVNYKVFDNVLVELYRVMNDSYSRFALTAAYNELAVRFSI